MGLLRRAVKEIRALQREVLAERIRAEKAEEQFDELSIIHNRVQQERDDLRRKTSEMQKHLDGLETKIGDMRRNGNPVLAHAWKCLAKQKEEEIQILNGLLQQRQSELVSVNAYRKIKARYHIMKNERKRQEMRRFTERGHREAVEDELGQAEADLAEAREVLRALRPVLQEVEGFFEASNFISDLAPETTTYLRRMNRRLGAAYNRIPWMEEWLQGD